jgi:hypothetical protein
MPTREQVTALLDAGMDYRAAAEQLGIPAGQAYLIATGQPADGGDSTSDAQRHRGRLSSGSQQFVNPPQENPTGRESVRRWIAARVAADAAMRAAEARRTPEPPPIAEPEASHDAITVLGRDHGQVKYLLKQLQALPSHQTGGSPKDLARRKTIVDMMTVRLAEHEAIEEEYLWPTVRTVLPDGDRWAEGALDQERAGKDTLSALGGLTPDSDAFDEHVEKLALQLRQHVAYEERVFLALREAMAQEALDELGQRMLAAKQAGDRPEEREPEGDA